MAHVDWDEPGEPRRFGPRGTEWGSVDSDDVDDLPQVRAAREQGWLPAREEPLWCFIPAIWPSDSRAWVHDTRVRQMTTQYADGRVERLPWGTALYFDIEADTNRLLAELGLPARPPGRVWLLKPPDGYATLQDVLDEIWDGWRASGGDPMATPGLVEFAQRRLSELF